MAKRKCIVLLSLVFVLVLVGQAMAAFTIDSFGLNHRRYEDGREFNRIYIVIKNARGQYITLDRLTALTLTDPNGNVVANTRNQLKLNYMAYNYLEGAYDGNNGVFFLYGTGTPYRYGDYAGEVPGQLIIGIYHLSVVYAGERLEKDFFFNGQVPLPIIPGSSIKPSLDTSGNLTATWTVPMTICKTRPTLQTSTRVFIDVYQGTTFKAELYVRIPTHMGRWFVPKALVDWLKSQGNNYTIGVQLRTNDNCNRTYSNRPSISLTSTTQETQELTIDSQEPAAGGEK